MKAARPAYPRVPDITRDELVEAVRRVLAGATGTEYYLQLFTTNVARPAASDLISIRRPISRTPEEART
ncbi:hypothetical protein OG194_43695 [Streptomyces sp. NBC_01288]|uniref:hypothetical protein n=1 Tax=Streptomyces sp. NBC_01288 TaxID=2903814 RepID=UPI002E11C1B9|nr:hypothetical protein OG194_43695 [Streptomyces sp. NBC_01288]